MDEQTPTPPDAGASEQPAVEPVALTQTPVLTDEQRLEKLLRNLLKGLVAAVAIFAVIYFFGQRQSHVEAAPAVPDQIIASAEASVRATPNDIALRLKLASAYAQGNRVDEALAQLREILKTQPNYRAAQLGLGQLLLQQGNAADAQSWLSKYVSSASGGEFSAQDPQLETAYFLLGRAESDLGNDVASADAYAKAVKIDPGDADAWYELGNKSLKLKQYDTALSSFDRAVAFVPTGWCEPYDGMSKAFAGLGNTDGTTYASAMVRICNGGGLDSAEPLKGLVNSKYVVGALYGLGLAAENENNTTAAIDYYQQLLSADRTNIAALSAINRLGGKPEPKPIVGKS
jgi:tetratricopeptide (TPR) repeat protein